MKLVHKSLERDGAGSIALVPEEAEDMWHAFNLIQKEDAVRASTVRKVVNESATGSRSADKVRTTLTVQVETIDFDTQAGMLRLKGRNIEENPHVKMGAYHTIDLELHKKFVLTKPVWDSVHLERIELATDPSRSADVAALIMAEGTALVVSCLGGSIVTLILSC